MSRAWLLVVLIACNRTPAPTPSPASAPASSSSPPSPSSPSSSSPTTAREPGTLSLDCGKPTDAPIPEGTMRVPPAFVVERPDVDAIVHHGTPSSVSEGWVVEPDNVCEHRYAVGVEGGGARARFEELARKLGVKPAIDEPKLRLYADAPKEGVPFFVMVMPVFGDEKVFVHVPYRGVDVAACMRRAVSALPPSLRKTIALTELGAPVRDATVTREEGVQPWCDVHFEWSAADKKIEPKVRAWIEGQGRKLEKRANTSGFAWDDGGEVFLTNWTASFVTPQKKSGR